MSVTDFVEWRFDGRRRLIEAETFVRLKRQG